MPLAASQPRRRRYSARSQKLSLHLGGQLFQELAPVDVVGEHRDREVEAREGGDRSGDAQELLAEDRLVAEEVELEERRWARSPSSPR